MATSNKDFRTVILSKAELLEALNALPEDTMLVTLGIEGYPFDTLLWASNTKSGEERKVVFIDEELKQKNSNVGN